MTDNEGTYARLIEMTHEKDERTEERPAGRSNERKAGRKSDRPKEQTTVRATTAKPKRTVEHRPYDFYSDQVRWLNRKKLDLEERYGQRVAATTMVQLAVDLLIADFEANGENSQLIRVLIRGEEPSVPAPTNDGERR